MSIMRCEKHNLQFDSDFHIECPVCDGIPLGATVRDLKTILSKYPDEMKIYLSSDAEGNSFHLLDTDYISVENINDLTDGSGDENDNTEVLVLWPEH